MVIVSLFELHYQTRFIMTSLDYEGEEVEDCIGQSEDSGFDTLFRHFGRMKDSKIVCRNTF